MPKNKLAGLPLRDTHKQRISLANQKFLHIQDDIIKEYLNGKSQRVVASMYSTSQPCVHNILKRNGIKTRNCSEAHKNRDKSTYKGTCQKGRKITWNTNPQGLELEDWQKEEILELHNKGASVLQICDATSVWKGAVRAWLRMNGITKFNWKKDNQTYLEGVSKVDGKFIINWDTCGYYAYRTVADCIVDRLDLSSIENIHSRGRAYNLDHIIPVIYGFRNKIDPYIISDISNLRIITREENMKKVTQDKNMINKTILCQETV
jgi:hypothetical protein